MATSSIYANVRVSGEAAANAFIRAYEAAKDRPCTIPNYDVSLKKDDLDAFQRLIDRSNCK